MGSSFNPIEKSFPLPKNRHFVLHMHMSFLTHYAMILLTTTNLGDTATSLAPLGSFVYAMPDLSKSQNAISAALVTTGSSIEYATRLAKILARKMNMPVYVGCSMSFAGVTVDEELDGLTAIVEAVTSSWALGHQAPAIS